MRTNLSRSGSPGYYSADSIDGHARRRCRQGKRRCGLTIGLHVICIQLIHAGGFFCEREYRRRIPGNAAEWESRCRVDNAGQCIRSSEIPEEPILALRNVAVLYRIIDHERKRHCGVRIVLQEGLRTAVFRALQRDIAVDPGLGHLCDTECYREILRDGIERKFHSLITEQLDACANIIHAGIHCCRIQTIKPAGCLAVGQIELQLDAGIFESEK